MRSVIDDTVDETVANEEILRKATQKEEESIQQVGQESSERKEEDQSIVESSIIEATPQLKCKRPESIYTMFDRARILNTGYDHLPGLTVSTKCNEI